MKPSRDINIAFETPVHTTLLLKFTMSHVKMLFVYNFARNF